MTSTTLLFSRPLCRFCPSVLMYLISTVPAIWILELQLMKERVEISALRGEDVCLESGNIYTNGSGLVEIPGVSVYIEGVQFPAFYF